MSSPCLSSRNDSPNSVLSKDPFLCCTWTLSSDVLTQDCCCRRYCRYCFSRDRGLPASWRQRDPDTRLKIHLRVNVVRILWALLEIFHCRLWRFVTQIIEVFFLFAQLWAVIHNPRFVKIHIRHSRIFHDGTCTEEWFWIHSRNFSLVSIVIHFVSPSMSLSSFWGILVLFVYSSFWSWSRALNLSFVRLLKEHEIIFVQIYEAHDNLHTWDCSY